MKERISEIQSLIQWYQVGSPHPNDAVLCSTRDVFQARIEVYLKEQQRVLSDPQRAALLISVMGELGNNSFDHNLGKWQDEIGCVFHTALDYCVIIDRGQVIRSSLRAADVLLETEGEYVKTAFTRVISGRAPERRGNGLKLVASIAKRLNLSLYFRSGEGVIRFGELLFDELDEELGQCSNPGVFCMVDWSKKGENRT